MSERITAAAIKFLYITCVLPPPARHHHILRAIANVRQDVLIGPDEQGFVTSAGRFVDRSEARRIAVDAGQTNTKHSHLFSEDLW